MLDVGFKDDQFRAHSGNIAENMGVFKGLTLNLLKRDNLKKSIAKKRERAGWNNDYLIKILECKM